MWEPNRDRSSSVLPSPAWPVHLPSSPERSRIAKMQRRIIGTRGLHLTRQRTKEDKCSETAWCLSTATCSMPCRRNTGTTPNTPVHASTSTSKPLAAKNKPQIFRGKPPQSPRIKGHADGSVDGDDEASLHRRSYVHQDSILTPGTVSASAS